MALIMLLLMLVVFIFGVIGVYAFAPLSSSNALTPYKESFKYGFLLPLFAKGNSPEHVTSTLGSTIEVLFQLITMDNCAVVIV